MILKVCRYHVDSPSSWIFIGDVAELEKGLLFLRKFRSDDDNVDCLGLFEKEAHMKTDGNEDQNDLPFPVGNTFLPRRLDDAVLSGRHQAEPVSVAYLRLRDGTHNTVAFWEAYLLNDEGKTIERL